MIPIYVIMLTGRVRDSSAVRDCGVIKEVSLDEIVDLRWRVLRPGLPRETAIFAEDALPGTFHVAYLDGDTVVSCVTFVPEDLDGEAAWRFRGMATDESRRGQGVGGELLRDGLARVAERGGDLVWCNARLVAARFYARHGFTQRGEQFDIPGVGPHLLLVKRLAR